MPQDQLNYDQYMSMMDSAGPLPQQDPPEGDEEERGFLSRFWGVATNTGRAAVQGAKRGVNELVEGAFGGDEEGSLQSTWTEGMQDLSEAAGQDPSTVPTFRPLETGERMGGAYGFIEGATQFAVGMLGARKVLAPVKALRGAGSLARSAAEGAAADLTVFDPFEERLSDLVQDSRFANPITGMLQADEDDSEFVASFKMATEGLLLGTTADLVISGIRGLRVKRAVESGRLTESEGARRINEIIHGSETTKSADDGVVEVEHTPGEPSVVRVRQENLFDDDTMHALTEGEGAGNVLTEGLKVDDPVRAEAIGASGELIIRNERIPRDQLTDLQREQVQAAVRRLAAGDSEEAVLRDIAPQLNLNHVQSPEEAQAWIKAIGAEAADVAKALANRASDGNGRRWNETIRNGLSWVTGVSDRKMEERLRHLYAATEQGDGMIYGAKLWVHAKAAQVVDLSNKIETSADPRLLETRFDQALDSLWEGHNYLAGTLANYGRNLQAAGIPLPEDLLGAVRADIHDDAVETGAKAAGDGSPAGRGDRGAQGKPGPAGKVEQGRETVENLSRSGKSNLQSNAPHIRRTLKKGDKISQALTKTERRALARTLTFSGGDPKKVLDALRVTRHVLEDPKDPTRWERAMSLRANMMLSGPQTQLINLIGNATAAFQVPIEYWWAGKRMGGKQGGALSQQAEDMLVENVRFLLDSVQGVTKSLLTRDSRHLSEGMDAVTRTWKEKRNILDPEMMQLEHQQYAHMSMPKSWLQTLVNLPSRALMTGDEFFKQMNYRSHVTSQSLRLSREQGADAATRAKRLAEDLHMAFDREGGATNVNALAHARYTTWSNKLEPETLGGKLQSAANDHPTIRLIFPFVRTPVNLFRFAWDRTPVLNRWSKLHREDIRAGGERAAIARARTEAGMAMYSMGALMASMDAITGSGPDDSSMRQQWLDAGNQPYSIKIGGKWISYRRLEPLSTPFAIMADFFDVSGELDEADTEKMLGAMIAGFASSVTSKTFLQGLTMVFDAFASGDEYAAQRIIRDIPMSFVMPNFLRQTRPDDTWREVRTYLDEFRNRVWWLGEGLEPKRNIFGEPVRRPPGYGNRAFNPFTMMDAPDDEDTLQQLVELGRAMPMPGETWEGGRIDLTDRSKYDNGTGQSPYDRMLELMADPPGRMRPLREEMERMMQSTAWEDASDGDSLYPGGLRYEMARDLIMDYQQMAKETVLAEYPKLDAARVEEKVRKDQSLFETLADS